MANYIGVGIGNYRLFWEYDFGRKRIYLVYISRAIVIIRVFSVLTNVYLSLFTAANRIQYASSRCVQWTLFVVQKKDNFEYLEENALRIAWLHPFWNKKADWLVISSQPFVARREILSNKPIFQPVKQSIEIPNGSYSSNHRVNWLL